LRSQQKSRFGAPPGQPEKPAESGLVGAFWNRFENFVNRFLDVRRAIGALRADGQEGFVELIENII
jgi:hypothetical protein